MQKTFAGVTINSTELDDIVLSDLMELLDKEVDIRMNARIEKARASGENLTQSQLEALYNAVLESVIADVDALFGSDSKRGN